MFGLVRVASAAILVAVLMVFAGQSSASSAGQFRCVSPEVAIANIQDNHPSAVTHVMSIGEFAAFAEGVGLRYGDAAIWFERQGVAAVYIAVFVERCRVGGGEVSRERLMALLRAPVA